jgi:hypothetical protein
MCLWPAQFKGSRYYLFLEYFEPSDSVCSAIVYIMFFFWTLLDCDSNPSKISAYCLTSDQSMLILFTIPVLSKLWFITIKPYPSIIECIRGLGCYIVYIIYKSHVCTHLPMQTYTWVHVGMEHSVFLHKAMLWLDLQSLRKATFLLRSCLSLIGCLTSCDSEWISLAYSLSRSDSKSLYVYTLTIIQAESGFLVEQTLSFCTNGNFIARSEIFIVFLCVNM